MKGRRKYSRRFFRGWVLTLLWALLSAGILLNAYGSHRNFRKAITEIFNEEQVLNVHLLQRMILDHIDEATESLTHVVSMVRGGPAGGMEIEGAVRMILRDHREDFSSISVVSPEGALLYHSLGEGGVNPLPFARTDQIPLAEARSPLVSERIFNTEGEPSTYIFVPFRIDGAGEGNSFVVGELKIKDFLAAGMADYRGRNISFVVADYMGDIYYIANISHQKKELMERGHLFPPDETCLGCHDREAFADLARAAETEETTHAVYKSPEGVLLNRTSALVRIMNDKWIVSVSVPYDNLQGQIDRNFNRNGIAAVMLLFLAGSGSLLLYLNNKQRALEEQYYSIVDSIGVGLCRIDGEGRILSANPAMKGLLGAGEGHALEGKVLGEYCASPERFRSFVERLVEGPSAPEFELEMMRREGGAFYALLSARAVRSAADGFGHIDLVVYDISDRRSAEESLQVAKQELERQNEELKKVDRIKDALIGDVSHELKTPVAKLVMHLDILKHIHENFGVSDKTSDIVEVMEDNIRRQQSVIKNILMTSRLEAGGRRFRVDAVRLDKLVEGVIGEHMHSLAALGVRVEQDLAEVVVEGDEEMLWHVVSNLVDNAVKYRSGESPWLGVSMEVEGGEVVVRVSDNGVGLSGEEQKKAFDRFYQSVTSTEGIGLGLHICLTILERMGGGLELKSDGRGKGTTAEIRMPRG